MSDRRLRELERRWAESRDPGDELALVRARLQAGVIDAEALALAAYCGAQVAFELQAEPPTAWATLVSWGAGLLRWGRPVPVRASVSALRHLFETLPPPAPTDDLTDLVEGQLLPRALRTLEEIEGWVLAPIERTRKRVARSASPLERASVRLTEALRAQRETARAAGDYASDPWAALSARQQRIGSGAYALRACMGAVTSNNAAQLKSASGRLVSHAIFAVAEQLGEHDYEAERLIAGREVAAWALGHADPVRARAARREP